MAWLRVWVLAAFMALALGACGEKKPITSESFVFGTRVEVQVAEDVPEAQVRAAVGADLAPLALRAYGVGAPGTVPQHGPGGGAGVLHRPVTVPDLARELSLEAIRPTLVLCGTVTLRPRTPSANNWRTRSISSSGAISQAS